MTLTKRQKAILDYIEAYCQEKGHAPTYREIMAHFHLRSTGSIYNYVQILKKKGCLENEEKYSRLLVLEKAEKKEIPSSQVIQLPFIGYLTLGFPIETFSKFKMMTVPKNMVADPECTYILQAKNSEITEELIMDGDLLLVEARQEANAGEMIVVTINHHDTVIKRFYPEGTYSRLEGSRLQSSPMIFKNDELQIQGILIGLLRLYEF